MGTDRDPETVFDVLGSEEVRKILALTDVKPMSVQELSDRLEASEATVYRRVNTCEEYDLLTEDAVVDEGNQYKVYEANLERVTLELNDGGFDVELRLRRDLVDQFGNFWSDLEGSSDG
ncbi:MAG: ArsR/SmtB family transcription factor [Halosimplex sp.]